MTTDALTAEEKAAAVALSVLRRALVEGQPVTRELIAHEAGVVFDERDEDALRDLDAVGARVGVSSLI